MAPGDLLLTGTPGGTALKAPPKIIERLAGLLPPATRWKLFFKQEAANPRYLHDGDVITATIACPDGRLDLGTQTSTVIGKTPCAPRRGRGGRGGCRGHRGARTRAAGRHRDRRRPRPDRDAVAGFALTVRTAAAQTTSK